MTIAITVITSSIFFSAPFLFLVLKFLNLLLISDHYNELKSSTMSLYISLYFFHSNHHLISFVNTWKRVQKQHLISNIIIVIIQPIKNRINLSSLLISSNCLDAPHSHMGKGFKHVNSFHNLFNLVK